MALINPTPSFLDVFLLQVTSPHSNSVILAIIRLNFLQKFSSQRPNAHEMISMMPGDVLINFYWYSLDRSTCD